MRALRRPVVLAYHGVGAADDEADPNRLVLDPRLLEDQVRILLRAGYRFRTAGSLAAELASGPPEPKTAVLTFDDGWLDAVTEVVPLLGRLGVPASFYVCPGWSPRWATMAWKPMAAPRMPAPPRHGAWRLALKLLGARRPTR